MMAVWLLKVTTPNPKNLNKREAGMHMSDNPYWKIIHGNAKDQS